MRFLSITPFSALRIAPTSRAAAGVLIAISLGACGKKSDPPPATATVEAPKAETPDAAPAKVETDAAPAKVEADAAPAKVEADAAPGPGDAAPAPSDAAPSEGDAATAGPVDATCEAIVQRSNKAREAFAAEIGKIPEGSMGPVALTVADAEYGGCVGEGSRAQGTWAFELLSGEVDAESLKEGAENGATATLSVGLVWVGPDGKTASTSTSLGAGFFSSSLAFERANDFDRDGRPDLVIAVTDGSPDHRTTAFEFYRATDAGVERFWKDVSPAITGLEDIDGDGVLDLLHGNELVFEQGLNKIPGLPGVTHVAGLDKLERANDAVKGYFLKRCPTKKAAKDLKGGEELEPVLVEATCAWFWGEDGAAIDKKVNELAKEMGLGDELPIVSAPWLTDGKKPQVQLP
jgi:hypothetical protein